MCRLRFVVSKLDKGLLSLPTTIVPFTPLCATKEPDLTHLLVKRGRLQSEGVYDIVDLAGTVLQGLLNLLC